MTNNWFLPSLFLIFLTLKLTETIAWSWWWVTAPLWGPFILVLLVFAIPVTIAAIVYGISKLVDQINRMKAKRGASK